MLGQNEQQRDNVDGVCCAGYELQREPTERTSGTRDCRDKGFVFLINLFTACSITTSNTTCLVMSL